MDPVGNVIAQIKNAQAVKKAVIYVNYSKFVYNFLDVLQRQGYLEKIIKVEAGQMEFVHPAIEIVLKYHNGNPVIMDIQRISKPGRRVYVGCNDIPDFYSSLGNVVLSTSKGQMLGSSARVQRLGGELICKIF